MDVYFLNTPTWIWNHLFAEQTNDAINRFLANHAIRFHQSTFEAIRMVRGVFGAILWQAAFDESVILDVLTSTPHVLAIVQRPNRPSIYRTEFEPPKPYNLFCTHYGTFTLTVEELLFPICRWFGIPYHGLLDQ